MLSVIATIAGLAEVAATSAAIRHHVGTIHLAARDAHRGITKGLAFTRWTRGALRFSACGTGGKAVEVGIEKLAACRAGSSGGVEERQGSSFDL
jgi:hypothetical protein